MSLIINETASAKVNLYLHVTGRRPDGYHQLDSLVVFAAVADRLSVVPAPKLSLGLSGPFAAGLDGGDDNLVLRAARALAAASGIKPSGRLTLEKHLPVASGIGGGSADAAAALRLLCRLWDVAPGRDRLDRIALALGADVPACLLGQPVRMAGIGERLLPAPGLPDIGMVLINCGVGVSTPAVFHARRGNFSAPATLPDRWADAAALAATLRTTRNDLQDAALRLAPPIGDVLQALAADPRCLLARMSGSGATCFGIYPSGAVAEAAAAVLGRPGWWVWGGAITRE